MNIKTLVTAGYDLFYDDSTNPDTEEVIIYLPICAPVIESIDELVPSMQSEFIPNT